KDCLALCLAGQRPRETPGALVGFRLQRRRPEPPIIHVLERYRQRLGSAVDRYMSEKLQAEAWSEVVTLRLARRALENHLRTESPIHGARCPGARVNRTGNEFPKRFEVLENRVVRIEIVRRGVVKVGGDPYRVANGGMIHE